MRLVLIDPRAKTYDVYSRFAPGFPIKLIARYQAQSQPSREDIEAARLADPEPLEAA